VCRYRAKTHLHGHPQHLSFGFGSKADLSKTFGSGRKVGKLSSVQKAFGFRLPELAQACARWFADGSLISSAMADWVDSIWRSAFPRRTRSAPWKAGRPDKAGGRRLAIWSGWRSTLGAAATYRRPDGLRAPSIIFAGDHGRGQGRLGLPSDVTVQRCCTILHAAGRDIGARARARRAAWWWWTRVAGRNIRSGGW